MIPTHALQCGIQSRYQKHSYSRPPGEHHRHISPSKRCHNALGQRLFKTEPLYSPTTGDETNPGFFQSLLTFFAQLWSPATTNPEKLGYAYIYGAPGTPTADTLLGEYGSGGANSAGSAIHVYLPTPNGPMPMAAFINGAKHAVHADHLNTPRKLTRANSWVTWQWAYSAFGDAPPTLAADRYVNPSTTPNAGTTSIPRIEFNLRYPGQVFDKESNLSYNYFRSYRASDGRYTQADPIGLEGGWNRFGYVGGNALSRIDPLGLIDLTTSLPTSRTRASSELICQPSKKDLPFCENAEEGQPKCECEYRVALATCGMSISCIVNAKRKLESCLFGAGSPKGKG